LQGIREAQKLGKFCGFIAAEPGYDSSWVSKQGVDLDRLIVTWPDDGKEAFEHLQKMILDDDIEFIVFDSIGALLRASETELDGNMAAGGQAGLITWGVKRAWTAAYKRNKYIIFLNQVRDVMSARFPALDSPGGHALKHASEIRVYIRPSATRYTIKDGDNVITVGQEIIAEIKRTKRDQGTGKRAVYDFYSMETDEYPFGVDRVTDVINTAKRTNVIEQGGAWYRYEAFPDGRLQGKDAVGIWLRENPDQIDIIRQKVVDAIR
jgi:recombination protein RecA